MLVNNRICRHTVLRVSKGIVSFLIDNEAARQRTFNALKETIDESTQIDFIDMRRSKKSRKKEEERKLRRTVRFNLLVKKKRNMIQNR